MDEEKYKEWEEYLILLKVIRDSDTNYGNMMSAHLYLAEHFPDAEDAKGNPFTMKDWRKVMLFWMQNCGEIDRRLDA